MPEGPDDPGQRDADDRGELVGEGRVRCGRDVPPPPPGRVVAQDRRAAARRVSTAAPAAACSAVSVSMIPRTSRRRSWTGKTSSADGRRPCPASRAARASASGSASVPRTVGDVLTSSFASSMPGV
ncbi:hypothetical protein [Actinomadura madurae]|uniref:hypothetical protein n=1 Tax=Actinomadura madurae TaxID=1993 RepID=UPI0027E31DE4|nr:hypothetical protein [Actinomadura madurae]